MKALRITAPRKVEFIEIPLPQLKPNEVQVKLEMTCLCGSDSPFFNYDFEELKASGKKSIDFIIDYDSPSPYPLNNLLSLHECVGTVTESASERFKQGDFVLALPFDQHGFAEYLTLPSERIFKLPSSNVSKKEILMCQPLGTILYGFRKLPPLEGKTVIVIGQGPIGLMMNHVLAHHKPAKIIAIDKIASRSQLGLSTGANHALHNHDQNLADEVQAINGGQLADLVIESAGHRESAIDLAVDLAKQDGCIFNFGVVDDDYVDRFPLGKLFYKNLTLLNSVGAKHEEHFLEAARMIVAGEIDVKPLLTHTFPVLEAQTAYEYFVDRKDGAIKVLIDFEA